MARTHIIPFSDDNGPSKLIKFDNDNIFGQVSGPMAKGVAAIGSSYIAVGLHTGEVNISDLKTKIVRS